ncbi:hypothetical protein [Novimethylophilus kurashikiensis]|nr:hypothetical protein [Novimethylophilus kurashikiensis]
MRKVSLSLLTMTLLAGYMATASAAPANPLVRPAALAAKVQSAQGQPAGNAFGMPPPPPALGQGAVGNGQPDANQEKTEKAASNVQTQLSKYAVVAISGDTAILRALPGVTPAMSGDSNSAQSNNGMIQPVMPQPVATGTPTPATQQTNGTILPSLIVKNKQRMLVQDVEVMPEVRNGQVSLRAVESNRTVFYGRVDGMSLRNPSKGMKVEAADMAYVQRNYPEVGGTGSSNGSTSTNNATGMNNTGAALGLGH